MYLNNYNLTVSQQIRDINATHYMREIRIINKLNKDFIALLDNEHLYENLFFKLLETIPEMNKYFEINEKDPSFFFQFIISSHDDLRDIIVSLPFFVPTSKQSLNKEWNKVLQKMQEDYYTITLKSIIIKIMSKKL